MMTRNPRIFRFVMNIIIGATALATPAAYAVYPERPIRLIVPFPAGGPTDAMARIVSENLTSVIGKTVIVENRGGAGGVIATEAAASSKPDGYTLFFSTTGTMAINPAIYPEMKVNPLTAFEPVGMVATTENVLVVPPSLKVTTVSQLLEMARTKPGALTYGSAGVGSSNHLSGALLAKLAKVKMLHVPYKGSAAALTDLLGGRITMMFDTISNAMPNIEAGKVIPLGVTGKSRAKVLAQVPTIAESGLPDFEVDIWFGLSAPAGTPPAVVATLNESLNRILSTGAVKEKLASFGATPVGGSASDFGKKIEQDASKWRAVVMSSGTTAQ